MRRNAVGLWLIIAVALSNCGGDGATLPDPGPSVALDGSATISGLSSTDDATLCEWVAGRLGGWGRSLACGSATVSSPTSETKCVSDFESLSSTCPITVGDLQNCVDASVTGPCPSGSIPAACFNLVTYGISGACP